MKYIKFIFISIGKLVYYIFTAPSKLSLKNVKKYFTGNKRKLFYEDLEPHIKEQFLYRVTKIDNECLTNKMCPCECPVIERALADEGCDKGCYLDMLDVKTWGYYKGVSSINMKEVENEANIILSNQK